ncbi:MAG TPA: EAL domain-containing protein [Dissulfurispiraceae bacterium]
MRKHKNISDIVTWLVALIVCVITVIVPIGYFLVSYEHLMGGLETEAEIKARIITQIISANPEMWQFEQVRLKEYLSHRPAKMIAETRRIFNIDNEVVAESADPLPPPVMARSVDLFDSGFVVGRLEVSRSLRPLLIRAFLTGGFMAALGATAFFILRIMPIRAIRRAEGELRENREHLERTVAARTADLTRANEQLMHEIRERMQMETAVRHQANHDYLTGLPNRRSLLSSLSSEIMQAQGSRKRMALMYMDLDRFKGVNDMLGHFAGDLLLKKVAERLGGCIGESDIVARIGGDEFNILLTDIGPNEEAAYVAQEIIACMARPFKIRGRELSISSSIGISIYPVDGESAGALMMNADTAMYHAKKQGRNTFQFYSSVMSAKTSEQMFFENSLFQAIARGELVLYYQPQIDTTTDTISCAEALVRWIHPERGLLSPRRFIPVAEETGFIVPLDSWVLRTACAQAAAWLEKGYPPHRIAVNLSSRLLQKPELADMIAGILHDTGLEPKWLEIEITESTAMQNMEATISNLVSLRRMGITLAIDDFGTGYSSLSYLSKLSVDKIKLDRSFIREITESPDDLEIVKAIIAMARKLKLRVVGEGVENEEQFEYLRLHGCDELQGYYFSRPLPEEEFEKLLSSRNKPIAA